jgi:lipopolysaccharide/colanic/teichoic acid biosynthesis glycosyltransferase/ribosomal protein S18 acetylase RimI-like enzyme
MTGAGKKLIRPAPLKRLMDIVVAGVALVVLSPILIAVWIAVRRRMGSPALFKQTRPGLNGRPFEMIKFRTMRDAVGPEGMPLPDAERLTPFGRWLRATSLDELPEFWNVLKGQMALVGPRPLLQSYIPFFTPEEGLRHSVRPGITGYAQVMGRNTASWDDRLANDIWYVRNRTIGLDLKIACGTISAVLFRQGVSTDPRGEMQDFNVERAAKLPLQFLGAGDANEIAKLFKRTLWTPPYWATAVGSPRLAELIADVSMKSDEYIGVRSNGALVAVMQLRTLPGALHINNIAVDEAFRGARLGERLILKGTENARSLALTLDVDASNTAAVRLYQRLGFEHLTREDRVVVRNEDAFDGGWRNLDSSVALVDPEFFERYGIGQLAIDGGNERITVVAPGHLRLPDAPTEALVTAVKGLPYTSISVSHALAGEFEGMAMESFQTIRMRRQATEVAADS